MTANDQQKVINAGFVPIRADDNPCPGIKIKNSVSSG
jgi:uncharacterized protein involved in high-affinity Fe2+ transport